MKRSVCRCAFLVSQMICSSRRQYRRTLRSKLPICSCNPVLPGSHNIGCRMKPSNPMVHNVYDGSSDARFHEHCAFQPSRTPDLAMADTLRASRRKRDSYLPDCPPWGKAEADLRIDSRVVSSMQWALWINRSRMASLMRPPRGVHASQPRVIVKSPSSNPCRSAPPGSRADPGSAPR